LFSLPNKIFLNEDLTRTQVVELKHSRELVIAARHAGKWVVIRNLKAVIRDSFPLSGNPDLGLPNDGHIGRGNRVHAFPSVVGMAMGLSSHPLAYYMMLLDRWTSNSLPRHVRALFGLSQTFQYTIGFQLVNRK
jgi:hypothetical protein